MYEVEMKVRADHESVIPELDAAGASLRKSVEQIDVYFDAPHRDFAARDEALRLRKEITAGETTAVLTYKGPRMDSDSKTRAEHETTVGSPTALREALSALGFAPAATVEKTRDRYALGEFTISLDAVEGLGEFVEVEMTVTAEAIEQAQGEVASTLETLGLDPGDQITTSYLELLQGEFPGSADVSHA